MKPDSGTNPVQHALEEGMKRAVTELLILKTLSHREHYVQEITESIDRKSGGVLHIVFPYATLYRLINAGYIDELKKRNAPDGRRRQYYAITPQGREHLELLLTAFNNIQNGLVRVLDEGGADADEADRSL